MGKIIAIGGGKLKDTLLIDREIIRLSNKSNPRLLFIPTASLDSDNECLAMKEYFGDQLGCFVDYLKLIKENPTKMEIENRILNSDIIYVGGGNTLRMLKVWRKKGVDILLKKAYKKGIVLSGISAGAICWFRAGNSDSLKFGPKKLNKLIKVRGLNFIPLRVCPHYDSEKDRKPSLKKMIFEGFGETIALEDCTAFEYLNGKFRIVASKPDAWAYRVYKNNKKVIESRIFSRELFLPLNTL